MATPRLRIEIRQLGNEKLVQYSISPINMPENRGWVIVQYQQLIFYRLTPCYDLAKPLGVEDDDLTVCIDKFYPHGPGFEREDYPYLRKGVATKVLNQIISDAHFKGARLVHVATREPEMQAFLEKHGFVYSSGYKGEHYCKQIGLLNSYISDDQIIILDGNPNKHRPANYYR